MPTLAASVLVTTAAGDVAAAGFLAGVSAGHAPAECALLAAAAAAARISGRPIGDAYGIAAGFSPDSAARPNQPRGWTVGHDRVYHGPHDIEA